MSSQWRKACVILAWLSGSASLNPSMVLSENTTPHPKVLSDWLRSITAMSQDGLAFFARIEKYSPAGPPPRQIIFIDSFPARPPSAEPCVFPSCFCQFSQFFLQFFAAVLGEGCFPKLFQISGGVGPSAKLRKGRHQRVEVFASTSLRLAIALNNVWTFSQFHGKRIVLLRQHRDLLEPGADSLLLFCKSQRPASPRPQSSQPIKLQESPERSCVHNATLARKTLDPSSCPAAVQQPTTER